MANGRRQLANNLDQVAQDIIDFILARNRTNQEKIAHQEKLITVLSNALEKYKTAQHPNIRLISWFESYIIYPFTRFRQSEIESAKNIASESELDDRFAVFELIANLFSKGKCESTSLNSILLNELVQQVGKYESLDDDHRLSELGWNSYASKLGVRIALKDIFLRKATSIIEDRNKELAEPKRNLLNAATKKPKRLKMDKSFLDELTQALGGSNLQRDAMRAGARINKKPDNIKLKEEYDPSIQKLDLTKFIHVVENIEQNCGIKKIPGNYKPETIGSVDLKYKETKEKLEKLFSRKQINNKTVGCITDKYSKALQVVGLFFQKKFHHADDETSVLETFDKDANAPSKS